MEWLGKHRYLGGMAKKIDLTNAAAVLGRSGGLARAKSLTPKRRSEIAKIASNAALKKLKIPKNKLANS